MTCNHLSFQKQLSYLTANNDGQHTICSVSREEINTLVVVVYTVLIYVSEMDKETNKGFTSMEGSVVIVQQLSHVRLVSCVDGF